jgi:hypothetical protein
VHSIKMTNLSLSCTIFIFNEGDKKRVICFFISFFIFLLFQRKRFAYIYLFCNISLDKKKIHYSLNVFESFEYFSFSTQKALNLRINVEWSQMSIASNIASRNSSSYLWLSWYTVDTVFSSLHLPMIKSCCQQLWSIFILDVKQLSKFDLQHVSRLFDLRNIVSLTLFGDDERFYQIELFILLFGLKQFTGVQVLRLCKI